MSRSNRSSNGGTAQAAAISLMELAHGYAEAGDSNMLPLLREVERELRRGSRTSVRAAGWLKPHIEALEGTRSKP